MSKAMPLANSFKWLVNNFYMAKAMSLANGYKPLLEYIYLISKINKISSP